MKLIKKLLKKTHGYTLAELLLVITIFAIGVVPVYKMVINATKVQKAAQETYEATLYAQNLLQAVKKQIESDITEEYKFSRGDSTISIRDWLNPSATSVDSSLTNFLGIGGGSEEDFNKKYNTDSFLYEVHIWPMVDGKPKDTAILLTAYKDSSLILESDSISNPLGFTKVEIADLIKQHFYQKDTLLWTDLGDKKPIAIGELTYDEANEIKIRGAGFQGSNITINPVSGYSSLSNNTKLTYSRYKESLPIIDAITHKIVIDENLGISSPTDIIQIAIDLTKFPDTSKTRVIRIENNTKATVVTPVYDEKNLANIQIYPIQQALDGNIIVENRNKLEPNKNFIIGVIVRDAFNSTFGEKNKILSKIVDIYSYDYSKQ